MSLPDQERFRPPTDGALVSPNGREEQPVRLGKYELLAKIGSGGMATVHIARQRGLASFEKAVVVKTIRGQYAEEQKFIDMFVDEARISALLKHPNCVDVYDVGCDNGVYFIAMEHLAGQALKEILKAGLRGNPLDISSAVKIVADAAEALHAAHNLCTMDGEHLELVHRDVSPANIMVTYDGRVKLLDFGISKARGRITQTVTQTLKGKLGYMAPEVVQHEQVDRRADIFALGVVMWESLVLRPLFRGANEGATLLKVMQCDPPPPSELRPGVPRALDEICLRALARDPEQRYQTAEEMQRDILAVLGSEATFAHKKIASYMNQAFADRREREERMLRGINEGGRAPTLPPKGMFACGSESEFTSDGGPSGVVRELPLRAEPTAYCRAPTKDNPNVTGPGLPRVPSVFEVLDEPSVEEIVAEQGDSARYPDLAPTIEDTPPRRRGWLGGAIAAFLMAVVVGLAFAIPAGDSAPTEQGPASKAVEPEGGDARGDASGDTEAGLAEDADADDSPTLVVSKIDAAEQAARREDSKGAKGDKTDAADERESAESADDVEMTFAPDPGDRTRRRTRSRSSARRSAKAAPKPANDRDKAKEHYESGQREFFRGDLAGAREEFLSSLRAARGFAPAYRGLGLVFERQGKKASAKRAYVRYLQLAPKASDADSIRERLEKL